MNQTKTIVRYSDGTSEIYIEPCEKKMFRVSAKRIKQASGTKYKRPSRMKTTREPKITEKRLTRADRIAQILGVVNNESGLSYGEIASRIGVDVSYVFRLIKQENIQRT